MTRSATAATSCLYRLGTAAAAAARSTTTAVPTQRYHAAATNLASLASTPTRRSFSNKTLTPLLPTSQTRPSTSSQQCLSSLGTYASVRSVASRPPRPPNPDILQRGRRPDDPENPRQQRPVADPLSLRNEQIPFAKVQLVDEDNKLGDPTSLKLILKTFDPKVDFLKLVQLDPPVVKIINIDGDKAREREYEARVRLSRRIAIEDKELQVPWHAAIGDLQHKANTARSLIEKGNRVQLVFARRAGAGKTRWVTDAEKEEILALFADALSPVATRWKDDDRSRKAIWVSYWTPLESIRAEVRQKVMDGIVEKRQESLDKKEQRRLREEEKRRKAAERAAARGL